MQALRILRNGKIMNWLQMGWKGYFGFTYLYFSVCLPRAGGFFSYLPSVSVIFIISRKGEIYPYKEFLSSVSFS